MIVTSLDSLMLAEGLAGGFSHCIGMCGVFVVSYAGMPSASNTRFVHPERHVLFHGGRLLSLAVLGLLGGAIGQMGHHFAILQGLISLAVGLLMLGLAAGMAGLAPGMRLPEPDVLGAGDGRGRRLFLQVLQSRSLWKPGLVGLFVGLLPCGLTYNALVATLTLTPLSGAWLMLCFGLGTVPGLLTLGLFGNALGGGLLTAPHFRIGMTRVAAGFMAVMGIAFLWRGLTNL